MRVFSSVLIATCWLGVSACGISPFTQFASPGDAPRLDYDPNASSDAGTAMHDAGGGGLACAEGTHEEDGVCTADVRACEVDAVAGEQTYVAGAWGPCEAIPCPGETHAEAGACVANQRDCSVVNGTGSQTWQADAWSACSVVSCDAGFHSEDDLNCVSNARSCETFANGSGESTWEGDAWGACALQSCHAGYHEEDGACQPDMRACPEDAVANGSGTQTWQGTAYGLCQVDACDASYHHENNACVSDVRSCDDFAHGTGESQWNGSAWGDCELKACDSAHHEEAGACQSDVRACPEGAIDHGSGTQTWQGSDYGACVVETCDTGFHEEANACVLNLRDCTLTSGNGTGRQSWSGGDWGACYATSCVTDFHVEAGACIENSRACAVPNGSGLETWGTMGWGRCLVQGCDAQYEQHFNDCLLSTELPAKDDAQTSYIEVHVPQTSFLVGSPADEEGHAEEEAQHPVTLTHDFLLSQTEITQRAWKHLSGGVNPSAFQTCGDECPVEQVDWFAALAYANALSVAEGLDTCYTLTGCDDDENGWKDGQHSGCTEATFAGLDCNGYRLALEAEWEYAYRAGTTTPFYHGANGALDDCNYLENLDAIGWYCANSEYTTHEIAQKVPNALELYDMAGNVSEWVWDGYASHAARTTDDTALVDPSGDDNAVQRSTRGGSYGGGGSLSRAASRVPSAATNRADTLGFRLARTAVPN